MAPILPSLSRVLLPDVQVQGRGAGGQLKEQTIGYCSDLFIGSEEFLKGDFCGTNQTSQGPFGHFLVGGNSQGGDGPLFSHHDVAYLLSYYGPTQTLEHGGHFAATQRGKQWPQTTISTWRVSTVNGNQRSAPTSRQRRMASWMAASAYSRVAPWFTHPRIAGHSTTHTPTPSQSRVTLNLMFTISELSQPSS